MLFGLYGDEALLRVLTARFYQLLGVQIRWVWELVFVFSLNQSGVKYMDEEIYVIEFMKNILFKANCMIQSKT